MTSGFDLLAEHQYSAYAYLLGLYLGDGYLESHPRTTRLTIYLNRNQPHIIRTCAAAVVVVLPERRVGLVKHGPNCVYVSSYSRAWLSLFPQHGPGSKHTRPIRLEPWQRGLVRLEPMAFVRGCIESDGSRHRRIVNGKNYPAYCFSNNSHDILGLFLWASSLIGIRARQANDHNVSIAKRADVAALDEAFSRPPFQLWGWLADDPAFLGRMPSGKVS
jgi:hypothetical protein